MSGGVKFLVQLSRQGGGDASQQGGTNLNCNTTLV